MRHKRTAQPTRAGQLAGARVKIVAVHNHGLSEHVVIANSGTVPQPLGGWALAALRGNRLYFFPDDTILRPGMTLTIHSGQDARAYSPPGLFWTEEQMWSNHSDMALLFDHEGNEVDRFSYSHHRLLHREAARRKRLIRAGETWQMVEEPGRKAKPFFRQAAARNATR